MAYSDVAGGWWESPTHTSLETSPFWYLTRAKLAVNVRLDSTNQPELES